MRPATNLLTENTLEEQLARMERRIDARILTQRNLQHGALNKVLEHVKLLDGDIDKAISLLVLMGKRLARLERPWWRKLFDWIGRLFMSHKEKYEAPQLYPCPTCGVMDKLSHAKTCPRWDSGNVTVTPEAATLIAEGHG